MRNNPSDKVRAFHVIQFAQLEHKRAWINELSGPL